MEHLPGEVWEPKRMTLRLPLDLFHRIGERARLGRRTLHSEILFELETFGRLPDVQLGFEGQRGRLSERSE